MYIQQCITGKVFNHIYSDRCFVKLTNSYENHNGFQFTDGLNVDTNIFNPSGSCRKGGIYFTDIEEAGRWIMYGGSTMRYMRQVLVPDNAKVYIEENKFKADKIILSPRKIISRDIYLK